MKGSDLSSVDRLMPEKYWNVNVIQFIEGNLIYKCYINFKLIIKEDNYEH